LKNILSLKTLPFEIKFDEGAVVRRLAFVAVVTTKRFSIVERFRYII
jgi:hypothetical protein